MNRADAIRIRSMNAGDLPPVIAIASSLSNTPHWSMASWRRVLDHSADPRRIALVAAGPGACNVLGYAVACPLWPQAELETIAVVAGSQRRGIARGLLQALIGQLREAGIGELFLEVRVSNAPAIALYRGLGFQETGIRPDYYLEPVEDALLMRLELL